MDSLEVVGSSRVCGTVLAEDPDRLGSSLRIELRLALCMLILGPG